MPRSKQEAMRKKKKNRGRFRKEPPLPILIKETDMSGSPCVFFTGYLKGSSVIIKHSGDMDFLYHMGFFGKGNFSRSEPNFDSRKQRVNLPRVDKETLDERDIIQPVVMSKRKYLAHLRYRALSDDEESEYDEIVQHEQSQLSSFDEADEDEEEGEEFDEEEMDEEEDIENSNVSALHRMGIYGSGNVPQIKKLTPSELSNLPKPYLVALMTQVGILSKQHIATFVRVPSSMAELRSKYKALHQKQIDFLDNIAKGNNPKKSPSADVGFGKRGVIDLEEGDDGPVVILNSDDEQDEDDETKGDGGGKEKMKTKDKGGSTKGWDDSDDEGDADFWGMEEGDKKTENKDKEEKNSSDQSLPRSQSLEKSTEDAVEDSNLEKDKKTESGETDCKSDKEKKDDKEENDGDDGKRVEEDKTVNENKSGEEVGEVDEGSTVLEKKDIGKVDLSLDTGLSECNEDDKRGDKSIDEKEKTSDNKGVDENDDDCEGGEKLGDKERDDTGPSHDDAEIKLNIVTTEESNSPTDVPSPLPSTTVMNDNNNSSDDDVICVEEDSAQPAKLHQYLSQQSGKYSQSNPPVMPVVTKSVRFMSSVTKEPKLIDARVGFRSWDNILHFNYSGDPTHLPTAMGINEAGENTTASGSVSASNSQVYERVYPPVTSLIPDPGSKGSVIRQRLEGIPYLDIAQASLQRILKTPNPLPGKECYSSYLGLPHLTGLRPPHGQANFVLPQGNFPISGMPRSLVSQSQQVKNSLPSSSGVTVTSVLKQTNFRSHQVEQQRFSSSLQTGRPSITNIKPHKNTSSTQVDINSSQLKVYLEVFQEENKTDVLMDTEKEKVSDETETHTDLQKLRAQLSKTGLLKKSSKGDDQKDSGDSNDVQDPVAVFDSMLTGYMTSKKISLEQELALLRVLMYEKSTNSNSIPEEVISEAKSKLSPGQVSCLLERMNHVQNCLEGTGKDSCDDVITIDLSDEEMVSVAANSKNGNDKTMAAKSEGENDDIKDIENESLRDSSETSEMRDNGKRKSQSPTGSQSKKPRLDLEDDSPGLKSLNSESVSGNEVSENSKENGSSVDGKDVEEKPSDVNMERVSGADVNLNQSPDGKEREVKTDLDNDESVVMKDVHDVDASNKNGSQASTDVSVSGETTVNEISNSNGAKTDICDSADGKFDEETKAGKVSPSESKDSEKSSSSENKGVTSEDVELLDCSGSKKLESCDSEKKEDTEIKKSELSYPKGGTDDNDVSMNKEKHEIYVGSSDEDSEDSGSRQRHRPGKKGKSSLGNEYNPYSLGDDENGDHFIIANTTDEDECDDGGKTANNWPKHKSKWKPCLRKDPYASEERLYLMLEEAFFLTYGLGCLRILDNEMTPLNISTLWQKFLVMQEKFIPHYVAYHYFRSKGWVPKSGLKFGCDFILYREGPPFFHGSYSVVVIPVREGTLAHVDLENGDLDFSRRWTSWISLSGLNRITEHVSKELLLCYVIFPKDLTEEDSKSPKCISGFKVKEVVVSRWVSSREREAKDQLEEMP